MTSTSESPQPSKPERVGIVAHGRIDVEDAIERVRNVATAAGATVVDEPTEAELVVAVGALDWGARTAAVVDSGLPGPKGNRELFLHLVQADHPTLPDDLDDRIDAAVAAG